MHFDYETVYIGMEEIVLASNKKSAILFVYKVKLIFGLPPKFLFFGSVMNGCTGK